MTLAYFGVFTGFCAHCRGAGLVMMDDVDPGLMLGEPCPMCHTGRVNAELAWERNDKLNRDGQHVVGNYYAGVDVSQLRWEHGRHVGMRWYCAAPGCTDPVDGEGVICGACFATRQRDARRTGLVEAQAAELAERLAVRHTEYDEVVGSDRGSAA